MICGRADRDSGGRQHRGGRRQGAAVRALVLPRFARGHRRRRVATARRRARPAPGSLLCGREQEPVLLEQPLERYELRRSAQHLGGLEGQRIGVMLEQRDLRIGARQPVGGAVEADHRLAGDAHAGKAPQGRAVLDRQGDRGRGVHAPVRASDRALAGLELPEHALVGAPRVVPRLSRGASPRIPVGAPGRLLGRVADGDTARAPVASVEHEVAVVGQHEQREEHRAALDGPLTARAVAGPAGRKLRRLGVRLRRRGLLNH
jgi:hypothetical protein